MKYKTMLIKFMKEKNTIVRKHAGIAIITKADIIELQSWSEDICKRAMKQIKPIRDSCMCPWCQVRICNVCGYSARHGKCSDSFSRYLRIIDRSGLCAILDIPGIVELGVKYMKIVEGGKYANEKE